MRTPQIKSFKRIIPMIYAYTTPEIPSHRGWTKIGYTANQTVEERIHQQTHTADVTPDILWRGSARYQDGTDEPFTDHEFHDYLTTKRHVERKPQTEWFHIDGETSHHYFHQFAERDARDLQSDQEGSQYQLRQEQQAAVDQTIAYFLKKGPGSEFLWNAKPRFGKTLTAYDLVRQLNLQNVLVVTNRPSIANSWFDDFEKFIAWQTKLKFISETDALKKRATLSHQDFVNLVTREDTSFGQIAFESLQGLKGSRYFGGTIDKLEWIKNLKWDLLIIDEAHEGIDTYKTDTAFENIDRKYTLHLTGTPFKALAKGKFASDQIYNWSYADEQQAKADWNEDQNGSSNPYAVMPRLNMYTYQLSSMMVKQAKQGITTEGDDAVNPAFDLNEFFKTKSNGEFVYDQEVDHFLDTLVTGEKYPFSTPDLRAELAHTFWLLNRVDSAKTLAKKLKNHPVFGDYKVIVAAGDGKLDDDQMDSDQLDNANEKAFDRVQNAIKEYDKTITLSVGQLTTGVTVKPWTAVLMLSSMKSPAEYMQAAFRAQNPYQFVNKDGHLVQKQNAYVFDFDPTRTLTIFDEFANDLMASTANGKGTADEHRANIKKLLNFFPVIGEDENGQMVELDAKQVLSIPRRLKSQEVVKRGFMSNFLFDNIGRIFAAPAAVRNILDDLVTAKQGKAKESDQPAIDGAEDLAVNAEGEVEIPKERVIGTANELFGDKIYQQMSDDAVNAVSETDHTDFKKAVDAIGKQVAKNNKEVVNRVKKKFKLTAGEAKRQENKANRETQEKLDQLAEKYANQKKAAEVDYRKQQKAAQTWDELNEADRNHEQAVNAILTNFVTEAQEAVKKETAATPEKVVQRVAENEERHKKAEIEEDARAHLRGFSRTIPSFIMAYGDEHLNLQNFDDYTDDDVFQEVTGISEDKFRFLRDGGDYLDTETGKTEHFEGHLFDEVVFNDSIQQFLELKNRLSNYFDESNDEDIFDYIPPQKTNQIYTPKAVVKHMVDDLEANNPGIFADPDKTFADLYMKSGLYITEIIKRLFQNERMKELYPDDKVRIKHIMEHQVYGFAPTKIIYLIATNYIFGFDQEIKDAVMASHFKQIDAAECAKEGTLQAVVQREFGEEK